MKAKREHRVPLFGRAVEILEATRELVGDSPLVFPMRSGRPIVASALAHVVGNKVEAAYARSDLFERRLLLMDDWAAYLASTPRPR